MSDLDRIKRERDERRARSASLGSEIPRWSELDSAEAHVDELIAMVEELQSDHAAMAAEWEDMSWKLESVAGPMLADGRVLYPKRDGDA